MKILFVTEHYFPHRDANGNCVWHLVQEMQRQGHELTVLSKAVGKEQTLHQYDGQTHLVWYRYDADMKAEHILQLLRKHPAAAIKAFFAAAAGRLLLTKKRSNPPDEWQTYVIKKALYKVLQTEKIDLVIAAVFTVENAYACRQLAQKKQMPCPYAVYQVDSYVDNQTLDPKLRAKRLQYIQKIYQYATSVFLHPLQRSEAESVMDSTALAKVHYVEFPNLMQVPVTAEDKMLARQYYTQGAVNCAYFGALYADIRNPEYTLRLFDAMQNKQIHFHIFGACNVPEILEWGEKLQGRLHLHEAVATDICFQLMQSADILVNIGNSTYNQLPSKIFDYFSTGKPIVNIAKERECTTLPYMKQYPYGLTLFEEDGKLSENAKHTEEFIAKFCHKEAMSFDEVSRIFVTSTPTYVTNTVLEAVKSL